MDTCQIIKKARSGDLKCFEIIYKKYYDMILNYILKMGFKPSDAEEICDDVFIHVHQNFKVFRIGSKDKP